MKQKTKFYINISFISIWLSIWIIIAFMLLPFPFPLFVLIPGVLCALIDIKMVSLIYKECSDDKKELKDLLGQIH